MNFRDYLDYQRGGLHGYLAKGQGHHIQHPGAHGSHKWYIDRQGNTVYGERPLPTRPALRGFEEQGHYFHPGREATYLFTPHGEVHGLVDGQWHYVGHAESEVAPANSGDTWFTKHHTNPGNILEGKPASEAALDVWHGSTAGRMRDAQEHIAHEADSRLTFHRLPERREEQERQKDLALEPWSGPADPRDPTQRSYVSVNGGLDLLGHYTTDQPFKYDTAVWHGKVPGDLCDFCARPFAHEGYGGAYLKAHKGVQHACTDCQGEVYGFWDHNRDGTVGDDHDFLLVTPDEIRAHQETVGRDVHEAVEEFMRTKGDDGPYTG